MHDVALDPELTRVTLFYANRATEAVLLEGYAVERELEGQFEEPEEEGGEIDEI